MNSDSKYELPSKSCTWIAGGAKTLTIEELEKMLQCKLPEDYRNFLVQHGAVSVGDSSISGITSLEIDGGGGSVYSDTVRMREEYNLPSCFVVIEANDEAPYCMSIDENLDFGAVFCFQTHSYTSKKVASSFREWFDRYFLFATS